jgi:hypothetical protein
MELELLIIVTVIIITGVVGLAVVDSFNEEVTKLLLKPPEKIRSFIEHRVKKLTSDKAKADCICLNYFLGIICLLLLLTLVL